MVFSPTVSAILWNTLNASMGSRLIMLDGERPTPLQHKKTDCGMLIKIIGFVETFINGVVG